MVDQTVVTSFQRDILKTVEQTNPDVRRACFAPVGLTFEQSLTIFTGGILGDVDDCLRDGSDFVFVTPWALQGDCFGIYILKIEKWACLERIL